MYNDYALSSYLSLRFVYEGLEWKEGLTPYAPIINNLCKYHVNSADEIMDSISEVVNNLDFSKSALLLSGGIDSAIIASFMPEGAKAYTIRFIAENAIDETVTAEKYAKICKLDHSIIDITFEDYLNSIEILIKSKKAPLHPVEPALYIASKRIKNEGFVNMITGCNADGIFGGLDNLLSKEWELNEFIQRYSFIDYKNILNNYYDMDFVYKKYYKKKYFNVEQFIKDIFGYDTYLAFSNGINSAGCTLVAPYAYLKLKRKLDLNRIRNGESKYLLTEVFLKRFKEFSVVPYKIAFARPMDQWMSYWEGPKRNEFKDNININHYTGNQKWLLFCLEYFLNYYE